MKILDLLELQDLPLLRSASIRNTVAVFRPESDRLLIVECGEETIANKYIALLRKIHPAYTCMIIDDVNIYIKVAKHENKKYDRRVSKEYTVTNVLADFVCIDYTKEDQVSLFYAPKLLDQDDKEENNNLLGDNQVDDKNKKSNIILFDNLILKALERNCNVFLNIKKKFKQNKM